MKKKWFVYAGLVVIALVVFLLISSSNAAASKTGPGGEHKGEVKNLEYEIVYTNSPGTLVINSTGSHYDFPSRSWTLSLSTDYTSDYYATYPAYSVYDTINFEVHIRNTGKRSFNNLKVTAIQEYHKDYRGYDYPAYPGIDPGDPLPGSSTQEWVVERVKGCEEIVLKGSYYIPAGVAPGLQQIHLQIVHWYREEDDWSDGRIIIDDPVASLYCPPPDL